MTTTTTTATLEEQLSAASVPVVSVESAVYQQFKEEVGTSFQRFNMAEYRLKERFNRTTPAEDLDFMLRQKYGLLPPQVLSSERNMIGNEEKILAKLKRISAAR